jgi:intergrase/recombinase
MKTVTLGQYRFREQNGHVYVYLILDSKHERYLGPLHKLLPTLDSKGKNNVENSTITNVEGKEIIRENGAITSDKELEKFFNFCLQHASEKTCKIYLNYLKKPVSTVHASIKAWRMYYKMLGNEEELKRLKLPKSGSDLRYVSEDEIKNALAKSDEESHYVLSLLLESGARLSEIIEVLNEYDPINEMEQKTPLYTYYIYNVNWHRGRKHAFYLFHVTPLKRMSLSYNNVKVKLSRYINAKYIRKFVASKLFEMGTPVEVVDFLQSRAPASVAIKHYIYLFSLAKRYYEEKWIPYLQSLLR